MNSERFNNVEFGREFLNDPV